MKQDIEVLKEMEFEWNEENKYTLRDEIITIARRNPTDYDFFAEAVLMLSDMGMGDLEVLYEELSFLKKGLLVRLSNSRRSLMKKVTAFIIVVFFMLSLYPGQLSAQENEITILNAYDYEGKTYVVYDTGMDWYEAKAYCELQGGHLMTVNNQTEQDYLISMISEGTKKFYWLGATDEEQEGHWKWITGEPFTYTKWSNTSPDNSWSGGEDHLAVLRVDSWGKAYEWNDWNGANFSADNIENFGFICEWELANVATPEAKDLTKDIKIYLNDRKITFDQKPVIENGRTLVPVRAFLEHIRADVIWDNITKTILAKRTIDGSDSDQQVLLFTIDDTVVTSYTIIDGVQLKENHTLDVPAKLIMGRTMIPLRFISEFFGYSVEWDGDSNSIYLKSSVGSNTVSNAVKSDFLSNPYFAGKLKWAFDPTAFGWSFQELDSYIQHNAFWGNTAGFALKLYDVDIKGLPMQIIEPIFAMTDALIMPSESDIQEALQDKFSGINLNDGVLTFNENYQNVYNALIKNKVLTGSKFDDVAEGMTVALNTLEDVHSQLLTIETLSEISQKKREMLEAYLNNLPTEIWNEHPLLYATMLYRLRDYEKYEDGTLVTDIFIKTGTFTIANELIKLGIDYLKKDGVFTIALDSVRLSIDTFGEDALKGIDDAAVFGTLYTFQKSALNYYSKLLAETAAFDNSGSFDMQARLKTAAIFSMVSSNKTRELFILLIYT